MRRRDLFVFAGGTALVRAFSAAAQAPARVRRIGIIVARSAIAAARIEEFEAAMQSLGWRNGDNLAIDNRLVDVDRLDGIWSSASEMVASGPDTILAQSTPVTRALLAATRTIPVVFAQVSDPIGSGFVASFARPAAMPPGSPTKRPRSAASGCSC
jgi:putative tryptophan/tyrosine transport system substrate-binding protein